jgi:cell division cycle 14
MLNANSVELIVRRLYWVSDKQPPVRPKTHWFSVDESLVYQPQHLDFGPLDLGMIVRYCRLVQNLLQDARYERMILVHYTSCVPAKRSNSALLACAFQVLVRNLSPEHSWKPFSDLSRFLPFRDAGTDPNKFELFILDCLHALSKAQSLNWLDFQTFDLDDYQKHSAASNGNLTWIVPEKAIAFPQPSAKRAVGVLTPEEYAPVFQTLGVTAVVRVAPNTYDSVRFKKKMIRHYDVAASEASGISESVVRQFVDICRKEAVVAVHCVNGLGKSVVLIGCYAIKEFRMTGREFIAWARMCRPGAIMGDQQYFLCQFYDSLSEGRGKNRQSSIFEDLKKEEESEGESMPMIRFQSLSVNVGAYSTANLLAPATYKTRFNQLVKIDPLMLKLYGKKRKEEE